MRVHYNSSKPAQLNALAYTQGQDIEVGPGQEQHVPHEGWHVVQQMQGRVTPTIHAQGVAINDEEGLEHEAEVMGTQAWQMRQSDYAATGSAAQATTAEQREKESTAASEDPHAAIGASREKARLNFLSTYEQEAECEVRSGSENHRMVTRDRVAKQMVGHISTSTSQSAQRQPLRDEDELRMKPPAPHQTGGGGIPVSPDIEAAIQKTRGGVRGLLDMIHEPLQQAFGMDLSEVRIHSDTQADQLTHALSARAFTTGRDIFFRQGEYEPNSKNGQKALTHELTHVRQQHSGSAHHSHKTRPQLQSSAPSQVIQLLRDFEDAKAYFKDTTADGRTPTYEAEDVGHWHIHIIRDEERLGVIDKIFIRFEDLVLGNQHLLFDGDGNFKADATTFGKQGVQKYINFGKNQVKNLVENCKEVSAEQLRGGRGSGLALPGMGEAEGPTVPER